MSSSQPEARRKDKDKKKKRKSEAVAGSSQIEDVEMGSSSSGVKVVIDPPTSSAGPVFVNFPSVKPSRSTAFTIYSRTPGSTLPLSSQQTTLAGETADVEFNSWNRDFASTSSNIEGGDCQYLPALFDPSTNKLHLTAAPLYLMTHQAKRLRYAAEAANGGPTEYQTRRNELGEAFGTKKAKSAIKAAERNRVDPSAMEGVKGHLMESIGELAPEGGDVLPSEFIPVPDTQTDQVGEVYTRESMITDEEWGAIHVSAIRSAKTDQERMKAMPGMRSRWVENKMRAVMALPKDQQKHRLYVSAYPPAEGRTEGRKLLYYLALLLRLHSNPKGMITKQDMTKTFANVASPLREGTLAKFTESSAKGYRLTDKCKTKLLMWILCLCLALDNWSTDVHSVAKDLGMEDTKVSNMFRSLGCVVDLPSAAERESRGMDLAAARLAKRAMLKAPVKFPKQKRGAAVRR